MYCVCLDGCVRSCQVGQFDRSSRRGYLGHKVGISKLLSLLRRLAPILKYLLSRPCIYDQREQREQREQRDLAVGHSDSGISSFLKSRVVLQGRRMTGVRLDINNQDWIKQ